DGPRTDRRLEAAAPGRAPGSSSAVAGVGAAHGGVFEDLRRGGCRSEAADHRGDTKTVAAVVAASPGREPDRDRGARDCAMGGRPPAAARPDSAVGGTAGDAAARGTCDAGAGNRTPQP